MSTRKHKHRTKYTMLLVPDNATKKTKTFPSIPRFITGFVTLIAVAFAICVGIILYQQVLLVQKDLALNESRATIQDYNASQQQLQGHIESLSADIVSLNQTLSTNESAKEEAEEALSLLEQEVYDLCDPTGCPVTGTATVQDETDADVSENMVIFMAYTGGDVIAAGSGTVKSITDDDTYGHVLVIDHDNGYLTYYYTDEEPLVVIGDRVDKAEVLFHITKASTNVGYQIQFDNSFVDPWEKLEIYG